MISLLFICSGNICRSPALAAYFEHLADEKEVGDRFYVESAGITPVFEGQNPDMRMQAVMRERGIMMENQAKCIEVSDFDRFDMILVATQEILEYLQTLAPTAEEKKKLYLATHFSQIYRDRDIPDPYYGHETQFAKVLDIIEDSCQGLLQNLP